MAVVNKKIDFNARRAHYLNLISRCEKKIQTRADVAELEMIHQTTEGQEFITTSMNIRIHPKAKLCVKTKHNRWVKGLRFCPEDFCFKNFDLSDKCPFNRAVYETFHKVVKTGFIINIILILK